MTRSRLVPSLLIAVLGLALQAPSAVASDGVLEINQTCATTTGCFSGDSVGFPVTISAPGAYRLTSELITPLFGGANVTLVEVTGDDVDLDLNGFGLRGLVPCTGVPATCSVSGSGRGIDASGAGLAVHDGQVFGMGSHGVFAGQDAHLYDLTVRSNAGNGIFVSAGSLIEHVVANGNGGAGIASIGSVVVRDAVARGNDSLGISLQSGSQASGLVANNNASHGIVAGLGSEISDCTAVANGGDGVRVSSQSTVRDCTTRQNVGAGIGATGSGNLAIGVHSFANDRYSLEGAFVYQDSYLGCSNNSSFSAFEPGVGAAMTNGSNSVLVCVSF
ncbi:MAG: right-handed parallel beta-helix repeat-containing protein [Myxococcota bacterium]